MGTRLLSRRAWPAKYFAVLSETKRRFVAYLRWLRHVTELKNPFFLGLPCDSNINRSPFHMSRTLQPMSRGGSERVGPC